MNQGKGNMFIQEDITTTEAEGIVPGVQNSTPQQAPTASRITAVSNSVEMINCARCGAAMRKDARYCMKCGNLNYANQENNSMKQTVINNIKYKDYTGGLETAMNNGIDVPDEVVSYPYKSCLVTNIIIFLFPLLSALAGAYMFETLSVELGIVLVLSTLISFFFAYAYQRMLIKAGENWWSVFVPLYNVYVYYKIALGSGWYFLLTIVPIVGIVVSLVAAYKLAKKFNKSGLLMIFFPYIMIPIIGYNKMVYYRNDKDVSLKKYSTNVTLDGSKRTEAEKKYRAKKFVLSIFVFIFCLVVAYFIKDYIVLLYKYILKELEFLKNTLIK